MDPSADEGLALGVTGVMLPELDFDAQIALAQSLGLRYYQYRPRIIPEKKREEAPSPWGNHRFDLTPERLRDEGAALTACLRAAAMEPWGTLPQMTVTSPADDIQMHLEGAAAAEAHCVRCQAAPYPDAPFDYNAFLDETVEAFGRAVELARPFGLKLIVETHRGTVVAAPGLALAVCRHFDPRDLGVIFDIANFGGEGAVVAHLAVSVLRDYIDCVHIGGNRRVEIERDAMGARVVRDQMCPMTEGDLHLATWVRAIHDAGITPPLIIEDFTPSMSGPDRLRQSASFLTRVIAGLGN